ncbi:Putative hydroxypyruvate isomerase YgbM [Tritonibacter multivorans]|uniref:Putative hydroxypyruvate isomerase YgbM n=1 Tax=Tritonibacter multivorans TaxID=928856 RepID=A0A0N7M0B1_9RHOB|nr:TIM barrel protein [Tritonibacter multivorans]MDA7420246.1 TIM barrel protein [Tritonibacter multivorans]CUH79969.1 Putative hydroxypyruvate isomerase YgbM [Tritonibacter multivorans]SFB98506.1 hydroxypyruvate isomerase [Tritonibacter multivorans]
MPKFAANLSMLFAELPYLERFRAAAEAGFEAVEVLFPYDVAAKETQRALLSNGLELLLINAPPPNYTGGEPGWAALPGGSDRFQRDVRRVLRYSEVLKAQRIHIMAGVASGDEARKTFVENLRWAADFAPYQQFTIEPLNQGDRPGYFLDDYNLAAEILDEVGRHNVQLQYDAYHAQMIHGDALKVWETFGDRASHVQVAAAPSRCEPGAGPVDFAALFTAIDNSGYEGWVSAEYTPSTKRTEESLGWMPAFEAA